VGRLLKQWRERRGMSQLGLAVEAEISTRHLSFLERYQLIAQDHPEVDRDRLQLPGR
jgi:DNA-binding XRE family transcriptional regulator